jgi:hypothetical protein
VAGVGHTESGVKENVKEPPPVQLKIEKAAKGLLKEPCGEDDHVPVRASPTREAPIDVDPGKRL